MTPQVQSKRVGLFNIDLMTASPPSIALSILFSVAFALGTAFSAEREFTNTEGKKISAEIDAVDGATVILKKSDGKRFRYAVDKLSPDDQRFVRKWAKENVKLNVRVTCKQEMVDRKRVPTERGRLYNEQRAYKVTIHNESPHAIDGIVCHYRMFKTNRDKTTRGVTGRNAGSGQVDGKHDLPAIEGRGTYSFITKAVEVTKGRYVSNGNAFDHRENLNGVNLHFFKGSKLAATHYVGAYKKEGTVVPRLVEEDEEDER